MGASLLADDVAITSGISTITSVVGQVWTTMTGNPLVRHLSVLHFSVLVSVL